MPWLIAGAASIFAWETVRGDDSSPFSWGNILKIAAIAGAVYLAASALKRA